MRLEINFERFSSEMRVAPRILLDFVKNPVERIKFTPNWSWLTVLSIQLGLAMVAGVLQGLVARNFIDFLLGAFLFPVTTLMASFTVCLFFHYFFSLFHSIFLDFKKLYVILVLAHLPYLALHVFSSIAPPVTLIGFAITSLLTIVGISENFGISRKAIIRLVALVYAVFLIIWGVAQVQSSTKRKESILFMTPHDLDTLEKEVKQ